MARHRRHVADQGRGQEKNVLRARQALEELLGYPLDLNRAVEELSLSDRQSCGIVRALLREPKILVLDEATSSLDIATRDRLFALVAGLAARGVGVIFITHRMDEIEEIGDRITVMRSGETVARALAFGLDAARFGPAHDRLGRSGKDRSFRRSVGRLSPRSAGAIGPGPETSARRPPDRPRGLRR